MHNCGGRALSPLVYDENTLTLATAIRHRTPLFCSLYWRKRYQTVLVTTVNRPRDGRHNESLSFAAECRVSVVGQFEFFPFVSRKQVQIDSGFPWIGSACSLNLSMRRVISA